MLRALLAIVHVGTGAVWLGAMAYSLVVVQPRAERLLGTDRYEEFAATVAAGARWKVLAMAGALAASGLGLVAVRLVEAADTRPAWVALVLVKGALLLAVVAVFWYVSWRLWPRRLFALDEELPAVKRRFTAAAFTLGGLVGANLVLGVLADQLR
ncbi:MAG TPA: hypothetical protein VGD67_23865 [Pseudonocardiaceae bacterium]